MSFEDIIFYILAGKYTNETPNSPGNLFLSIWTKWDFHKDNLADIFAGSNYQSLVAIEKTIKELTTGYSETGGNSPRFADKDDQESLDVFHCELKEYIENIDNL